MISIEKLTKVGGIPYWSGPPLQLATNNVPEKPVTVALVVEEHLSVPCATEITNPYRVLYVEKLTKPGGISHRPGTPLQLTTTNVAQPPVSVDLIVEKHLVVAHSAEVIYPNSKLRA